MGSYIRAREGGWILTEIVDMLKGVSPDAQDFSDRAMHAINSLRRADNVWGHVVAYTPPHRTSEFVVPASLVTVDVVRRHARYIQKLRESA